MNDYPPVQNPVQPRRCGLALWSLVLGILSILLCALGSLAGVPAVICGHIALSRIKHSGGALDGQGLAIGGLVTGYISIALIPLIGLFAAIAIPNFVKARQTAQRNACIVNLRVIDDAKAQWALEEQKPEGSAPTPDDLNPYLQKLAHKNFNQIRCPAGGTYTIHAINQPPTCSIPGHELP